MTSAALVVGVAGCNLLLGVEGDYHLSDAGASCTAACCQSSDCPAATGVCQEARCDQGACVDVDQAAGTRLPAALQTQGDCVRLVCDGEGSVVTEPDDADTGASPSTCEVALCSGGAPATAPAEVGKACVISGAGVGVCDGAGACVGCNGDNDCSASLEYCVEHVCVSAECNDQKKSQLETDVDCGGPDCPGCVAGLACGVAGDCQSGVCTTAKTCAAPTCTDQVRNGTETDVDCGGTCPADCDLGRICLVADDCMSKSCCNGTCAAIVTGVSAGNGPTSCAVTTDHRAHCWGYATNGALGDGSTSGSTGNGQPTPLLVPGLDDVAQVVVGFGHACARKSNGTAWCWGRNDHGQLGIGAVGGPACTGLCVPQPTELTVFGNTVKAIAAGDNHTCVIKTNGTLWCWGDNSAWQIGGSAPQANVPTPVQIAGLTGVTQVSAGTNHTCVIKSDGTLWCWGQNGDGQLGNGTYDTAKTPTKIVAGTVTFAAVAAGAIFTCARSTTGTLWCWGGNGFGQLGTGSGNANVNLPLSIGALGSGVLSVAAATFHACAHKTDGSVWCWGLNATGEVGTGDKTPTGVPKKVLGMSDVVEVTAGLTYSCARKSDGSVWCWGGNNYGQLGMGNTGLPVTTPVRNLLGVCP